jgi:hypothetical protein
VQGKVREAIQRIVGKIVVASDGTMAIEARPDGLLGTEGQFVPLGCRGVGPIMGTWVERKFLEMKVGDFVGLNLRR